VGRQRCRVATGSRPAEASLWAVAVMAVGVPRRAFLRRKKAPQARCEWCTLRAARRRATVTRCAPGRTRRDRTVPPAILCWGHSPSQRQQGVTRGHRCMSVPISLRMTTAVPSAMPSMVVRATPARRESGVRASHRGSAVFVCRWALGGQGWPALVSPQVCRGAVLCGSHGVICGWSKADHSTAWRQAHRGAARQGPCSA
jgi:hypothetical protein